MKVSQFYQNFPGAILTLSNVKSEVSAHALTSISQYYSKFNDLVLHKENEKSFGNKVD